MDLQAYCLKVKEMDDMEIDAAVSGHSYNNTISLEVHSSLLKQ